MKEKYLKIFITNLKKKEIKISQIIKKDLEIIEK